MRALIIGVVMALVLLTTGAVAAVSVIEVPLPSARSSAFVPEDGAVLRTSGIDGGSTVEQQRVVHDDLPNRYTPELLAAAGIAEGGTDSFWRMTQSAPGSHLAGSRDEVLLQITDAGLVLRMSLAGRDAVTFDPGLIVLPADAEIGQRWESEGHSGGEDAAPYHFAGEILEATLPEDRAAGCRVVRGVLTLDGDRSTSRGTFCPGRGLVSGTLPGGWIQSLDAEWAAPQPVAAPAFTPGPTAELQQVPVLGGEDSFGWHPVEPLGSPVVTPDGVLVSVERGGASLLGHALDPVGRTGELLHSWTALPPGQVLSLTVIGGHILVATSTGALVAYDSTGTRLWQDDLGDLIIGDPVPVGSDRVVATNVTGLTTMFDLNTGAQQWSHRTQPADGSPYPVTVDGTDHILIDTREDELIALSPTGKQLWKKPAAEGIEDIVVAGSDLVVLSPADSVSRWDVRTGTSDRYSLAVLNQNPGGLFHDPDRPGEVLVRLPGELVRIGVAELDERGRIPDVGHTSTGPNGELLTLDQDGLHRRDGSGAITQSWSQDPWQARDPEQVLTPQAFEVWSAPVDGPAWWMIAGDEVARLE